MKGCPVCNSKNVQLLVNWGKYDILRCKNCHLSFVDPLPAADELKEFYQGFLFQKPEAYEIEKKIKKKKKELTKLFDLDKNHINGLSGKKFLDYGAGTGIAYKAACDIGLECYYQDLDDQAKEFTMKNFGLKPDKIIDDIEKCDETFDFIFSDNVIEHVNNPDIFLENLLNLLNDGGQLIIKTPHSGNTETYLNPMISISKYFFTALKFNSLPMVLSGFFARFWHCDPPRHLYSFSKGSFKYLVDKSRHATIQHDILYYRTPWFSNTITKRFFTRDKKAALLKSIIIRLLVWPVIIIEGILQVVQKALLSLGLLSPAGIILKIHK